MAKTPKVVPLQEDDRRLIAADEKTKRFILGIGKQRIAFDFTTRVTNLPPAAGDQPADVLPFEKRRSGDTGIPGPDNSKGADERSQTRRRRSGSAVRDLTHGSPAGRGSRAEIGLGRAILE